jgi:hypothetical protein
MSDKLQEEITKVVNDMKPPANAVGVLTAEEVERIIKTAATRGVMAGWVAGERTARAHWNREIDSLKAQIKELQTELIVAAK